MPLSLRLFPGDEELGKKDDEYKPGDRPSMWMPRRAPSVPSRRSAKRVVLGFLVAILVYYFFKNMPVDVKGGIDTRPHYTHRTQPEPKPPGQHLSSAKPAAPSQVERNFNGPIKFFDLAVTLHSARKLMNSNIHNQNVLFAAASLKSAAILLPIACEMATRERNDIHFAFMGRDDIPMDILKSVNGISKDCKIMFHDARPDFALQSTDFRMEVSCSAAFNHIHSFFNPQATLIDGSGLEEPFFTKGVNERARMLEKTVIDLPDNTEQALKWITFLDSSSLAAWNTVTIDLIVHAQPSASGSLIRLLESLKKADFSSSTPPRLTIELPHQVDKATKKYIEKFNWPPSANQVRGSLLSLHHRIPQHGISGEENSIRLLESFWPADPSTSHVMILSPQAEVSPLFFHYVKYAVLEYKYSASQYDAINLLGISLDLPSTHLNDSKVFKPPLLNGTATSFLWEAPNCNAALYFGDKWVELHDFISHLVLSQKEPSRPKQHALKEVGKRYPSWLDHIVKLARARGYVTLYPSFDAGGALVALHNELYQPPEEYLDDVTSEIPVGELGAEIEDQLSQQHKEKPLLSTGLLSILSNGGKLPSFTDMPMIMYDGDVVDEVEMMTQAEKFANVFRRELGGCKKESEVLSRAEGLTADLFCRQH